MLFILIHGPVDIQPGLPVRLEDRSRIEPGLYLRPKLWKTLADEYQAQKLLTT